MFFKALTRLNWTNWKLFHAVNLILIIDILENMEWKTESVVTA